MGKGKKKKALNKQLPSKQSKKRSSAWILYLGIFIVYVVLRINILPVPLERDEGLFGYVGQLLLGGGIPYLDVIDHKPPVVYWIYAFALLFFPATAEGIHLFLHVYNLATLITLFYSSKIYFKSNSAGLWTALVFAVFSSLPTINGFSASTEMFMLLPLSLCLLCALIATKKELKRYVFLSGILGAMACWTKHTGFFFSAFVLLYLIGEKYVQSKTMKEKMLNAVNCLLLWVAGAFFFSGIVIAFFGFNGALKDLYFWGFHYNFSYSQVSDAGILVEEIVKRSFDIFKSSFLVIGIGVGIAFYKVLKKDSTGWFLLGMLFFSYLATLPGYAYRHYFAQIAPAVAFCGGGGILFLVQLSKKNNDRYITAAVLSVLLVGIPASVHFDYYFVKSPDEINRKYFGANPFTESPDISKYISDRTDKDDTVFVFGSEAQIYFYSERKCPTNFALLYPLMQKGFPDYLTFQEKVWNDILTSKPMYIILIDLTTSLMWDGKAELLLADNLDRLCKTHYKLEAAMTIENPKGRLLLLQDIVRPVDKRNISQAPIKILRRR